MFSNAGSANAFFPQSCVFRNASSSNDSTATTSGRAAEGSAEGTVRATSWRKAVRSRNARQSSRLYVRSVALRVSSRVCSHRLRQTTASKPEN